MQSSNAMLHKALIDIYPILGTPNVIVETGTFLKQHWFFTTGIKVLKSTGPENLRI